MRTLLTAALLTAVTLPTQAMTYSYKLEGADAIVINATGEIMLDEAKIVSAWMKTLPDGTTKRPHVTFVFDSAGGNPYGANDIGVWIRKYGMHTSVAAGGQCVSACVIVWSAGVLRSVSSTSTVGVHGASYDKAQLAPDEVKNAPLLEATTTLAMAQQLHTNGAPDHIVMEAVMTPPTDMYWLTAQDYADWGVHVIN